MREKITIGTTSIGRKSKKLSNEILSGGRISMGKYVAQYHKVKECIAVTTGTDAVPIAIASCINFNNKKIPRNNLTSINFYRFGKYNCKCRCQTNFR